MNLLRSAIFLVVLVPATILAQTSIPVGCPVTNPAQNRFTPPSSYLRSEASSDSAMFYGTSALWTVIPAKGIWHTTQKFLPLSVFRAKLFWWREGYDAYTEPKPNLTVTAEQLGNPATRFKVGRVTNAILGDRAAMLVLIDIPSSGCWKIAGRYAESELSYIVWVGPRLNER